MEIELTFLPQFASLVSEQPAQLHVVIIDPIQCVCTKGAAQPLL